jgi:hypothetical protein
MFVAGFVSFMSFVLLLTHLSKPTMRRLVGYKGFVDVLLHGSILYMFFGTSTMGLLQAEAAGICFSLYLRAYSWAFGYERLRGLRWQRYAGRFT